MNNPNKTSYLKSLIILVLLAFIGYLLYSNSQFETQLIQVSNQLNRLQTKDSISSQYFEILDNDSLYILPNVVYKNGHPMTYKQLDSLVRNLEKQITIKDMVIKESQSIFHYQYNIQEKDSIIEMNMTYRTWERIPNIPTDATD